MRPHFEFWISWSLHLVILAQLTWKRKHNFWESSQYPSKAGICRISTSCMPTARNMQVLLVTKKRRIIRTGAVVGAGTMGGGIAWLMARNDMSPIMKDVDARGLELGLKQSESIFAEALKRRKISEDESKKKTGIA